MDFTFIIKETGLFRIYNAANQYLLSYRKHKIKTPQMKEALQYTNYMY